MIGNCIALIWLMPVFTSSGKTSLLSAIQLREFPIPKHIDTFLLCREMPPSDKTALECVIEVDTERLRLEKEAETLAAADDLGKLGFFSFYSDFVYCNIS